MSAAVNAEATFNLVTSGIFLALAALTAIRGSRRSPLAFTTALLCLDLWVYTTFEVLSNLGPTGSGLVVVDCRRPAVSVETLLALAPEMPRESRAVLWGERYDLEHHLSQLGASMPVEWVCCGPKATAEDVAAVVRILLE